MQDTTTRRPPNCFKYAVKFPAASCVIIRTCLCFSSSLTRSSSASTCLVSSETVWDASEVVVPETAMASSTTDRSCQTEPAMASNPTARRHTIHNRRPISVTGGELAQVSPTEVRKMTDNVGSQGNIRTPQIHLRRSQGVARQRRSKAPSAQPRSTRGLRAEKPRDSYRKKFAAHRQHKRPRRRPADGSG